ncbi:MAG: proline--tRNA ligase, partial [Candidatus Omnitrophica bacterium]|nr:proline--tRNA ligase [Candidatus Omnitrophota bacterium]
MKWTQMFVPTKREDPQDAEAISHKLMVRAGLIRRLSAGAYTYLPLGYKALKKAQNIVRKEMDSAGASELLMPALQPPELWKKSGRYDVIGDVMIKFQDRHGREVALGPTHEEVITDIVAKDVKSYKELPLILYQIQNKFRDELRPRFGIVRSCEFIMKDAYSFDVDIEAMEESYKKMYDAYCRIFEKCGLPYVPVEADPGLMGGAVSHEFMIPCDIGEDRIIICEKCGYAASTEVAEAKSINFELSSFEGIKMKEVLTPEKSSVKDVSEFLGIEPTRIIKTIIFKSEKGLIAVLVRGDHEINEPKIKKQLKIETLVMATEQEIIYATGCGVGFAGPLGINIPIFADHAVKTIIDGVAGANKKNIHI